MATQRGHGHVAPYYVQTYICGWGTEMAKVF